MTAIPSVDQLAAAIAPGTPLERVASSSEFAERLRARGDELLDVLVEAARAEGASWSEIGCALGSSKQAAQERFAVLADPPPGAAPFGLIEGAAAVLAAAGQEARDLGHSSVRPEHLLFGLSVDDQDLAARTLVGLGVSREGLRDRVRSRLGHSAPRPTGSLTLAPTTKRLLEHARAIAKSLGYRCVRPEHVLLAVLSPKLHSSAATLLEECGADPTLVRDQLVRRLIEDFPELTERLKVRSSGLFRSRVRVRAF